jgi:hyperosmotically inducible protein
MLHFTNIKEFAMKFTILGALAAMFIALAVPAQADKTTGDRVDDSTIQSSVKGGLLTEKGVPSSDINVETYKGVVLLSGFVKSQEQKDAAGRVASGVKGVEQVRNQLIVHPSTSMGTKIDDTVLVGKVKAALIDSADVKGGQINVEARDGIVQLGGFVTSGTMRDRAMAIAKGIEGVKSVDDALFVKPQ